MSDIAFQDVELYCEVARDACKNIFEEINSKKTVNRIDISRKS